MFQITAKVEGMQCGMCEAHVNDTIRKNFKVKKVNSSHSKGETIIISEIEISEDALKKAVEPTGYSVLSVSVMPYEKKGLFRIFK